MRKSLTKEAYERISQYIQDGTFAPGMALIETDLCERLQMSRTPIREALQRLSSEEMVDYSRARGFTVSAFSAQKLGNIYEMLEGLEGMMSYLLAEDHDAPCFAAAGEAVQEMERACQSENWDQWLKADSKFHAALYESCHNVYIARNAERFNRPATQVRMMITRFYLDKHRSTRDHRALYEAIIASDAEKARALAQDHYRWVRGEILKYLGAFNIVGG